MDSSQNKIKKLRRERLVANLKNALGITQSQLVVSAILLSGLLVGVIVKYSTQSGNTNSDILRTVLAEQLLHNSSELKKSITGSDTKGNVLFASEEKQNKKKNIPDAPIDINTASKLELMKIPGIGDKTADKIIEYRKTTPFEKKEDIQKIKGIGPKKFERMKEYITV